jgi:hypothetical protein
MHDVDPFAGEYVPYAQTVHELWPDAEYEPGAHTVHALCPATEYVPGAQMPVTLAFPKQYEPPGQGTQVHPGTYWPGTQVGG